MYSSYEVQTIKSFRNVTSIGKSTQIQLLSSMPKSPELKFLENYDLYVTVCTSDELYMHLHIEKHPGFEEISSSRCAQYILKLSGSNSEESYDLH